MKLSILARIAALIAAGSATLALLLSLAHYGLPADIAPQIAQNAPAVAPR